MDATVVLARFSSEVSHESERRERAAEELRTRFEARDLDKASALELLDTMAPEASISDRQEAARRLSELSSNEDWDGQDALEAAEEVSRLITGDRIEAVKRIEAAKELTRRHKSGDLDADSALNLMNDIAPGLSINKRREAAGNLISISKSENWNADTPMQAAESTFQLVTGDELNFDKRRDAAVDLVGEGVKRFGGDSFEDRDIDVATEMIKSTFRGDLTTERASDLLGLRD